MVESVVEGEKTGSFRRGCASLTGRIARGSYPALHKQQAKGCIK
jgi:hypothetical protein